jgi:hypothetical protein
VRSKAIAVAEIVRLVPGVIEAVSAVGKEAEALVVTEAVSGAPAVNIAAATGALRGRPRSISTS